MKLCDLKPAKGSNHRRKVLGRGEASGHGGSATKGMKGQNSRSGSGTRPGFEGGQMPLMRRIPKRGFTNIFRKEYEIVNLETLVRMDPFGEEIFKPNSEITKTVLIEKGLVKHATRRIKILGVGDIKKPLKITADKFSKSAAGKITAAGGEVIEIGKGSKRRKNKKVKGNESVGDKKIEEGKSGSDKKAEESKVKNVKPPQNGDAAPAQKD